MENKVRMVHCVFGTEMLVPESRVGRYLAAGHRLIGELEIKENRHQVEEKITEVQESRNYIRKEQDEEWEYAEGESIDPFAEQAEPDRVPTKKTPAKKTTAKKPASKKSAAKKPAKKGSRK